MDRRSRPTWPGHNASLEMKLYEREIGSLKRYRELASPLFSVENINRMKLLKNSENGTFQHLGCVNTSNWNDTGELIVTGSDDRKIKVWNIHKVRHLRNVDRGTVMPEVSIETKHTHNIFCAKFFPGRSDLVVSCSADGSLCINHLHETATEKSALAGTITGMMLDFAFLPPSWPGSSNSLLVAGGSKVQIFDIRVPRQGDFLQPDGPSSHTELLSFGPLSDSITAVQPLALAGIPQFIVGGRGGLVSTWDARKVNDDPLSKYSVKELYKKVPPNEQLLYPMELFPDTLIPMREDPVGYETEVANLRDYHSGIARDDNDDMMEEEEEDNDADEREGADESNDDDESDDDDEEEDLDHEVENESNLEYDESDSDEGFDLEEYWPAAQAANAVGLISVSGITILPDESAMFVSFQYGQIHAFELSRTNSEEQIYPYKTYAGHRNYDTFLKNVSLFGPNQEYVVSGSDCGGVFFWDRSSGELVTSFLGDETTTNGTAPNPNHEPEIVVYGIDNAAKLFTLSDQEEFDRFKPSEIDEEQSIQDMAIFDAIFCHRVFPSAQIRLDVEILPRNWILFSYRLPRLSCAWEAFYKAGQFMDNLHQSVMLTERRVVQYLAKFIGNPSILNSEYSLPWFPDQFPFVMRKWSVSGISPNHPYLSSLMALRGKELKKSCSSCLQATEVHASEEQKEATEPKKQPKRGVKRRIEQEETTSDSLCEKCAVSSALTTCLSKAFQFSLQQFDEVLKIVQSSGDITERKVELLAILLFQAGRYGFTLNGFNFEARFGERLKAFIITVDHVREKFNLDAVYIGLGVPLTGPRGSENMRK